MSAFLNFSLQNRLKLGFTNTVFGLSGTLFNFIFSVLVVRLFNADLWGSFAQAMLLNLLFSQFSSWGNRDFLIREFSRNAQVASLWQTSLLSRLLILGLSMPLVFVLSLTSSFPIVFSLWILANFLARSFDSVILFERKFKDAILIEVVGFVAITSILFIWKEPVTLQFLILIFTGSSFLKAFFYAILFRKEVFNSISGELSLQHLIVSFPFFLPGFIGFLQMKADTFAIALQLPKKELGEYYVLLSLLAYCHAVALLAITPLVKDFYRINLTSFQKIRRNFLLIGLTWSVFFICCVYLVVENIYHIHLQGSSYLIAWLSLPPYFVYYFHMQLLLRNDKPYMIVLMNSMAAAFNFILSFILISQLGFDGGLLSGALVQWMVLVGYTLIQFRLQAIPK